MSHTNELYKKILDNSINNFIILSGKITQEPKFSHEINNEKFYCSEIRVMRLNNVYDDIPLIISQVLLNNIVANNCYEIHGNIRTHNKDSHVYINIFVNEIKEIEQNSNINEVILCGYLCKNPTLRNTSCGKKISDLLVAVNRSYGKTDYIPCIVWNKVAEYASELLIGNKLYITGRIQSRKYKKCINDTIVEKTAYEVSAGKIELIN